MGKLKYIQPNKLIDMVGEEHVIEMLENYRDSLTQALSELQLIFESQDQEAIRLLAHKMKSSTRVVGAEQLADHFQELERLAAENSGPVLEQQRVLNTIKHSVCLVESEINIYINSLI